MSKQVSIICPLIVNNISISFLLNVKKIKINFISYIINIDYSVEAFDQLKSNFASDDRFIFLDNDKKKCFEEMCNKIVNEIDKTDNDILILSEFAFVDDYCIEKLEKTLNLTEKNAVIFPRTNNADYIGLPIFSNNKSFSYSLNIFERIKSELPTYYNVNFLFRFCYLIKRKVISLFGLFSPSFYNSLCAEFDFISRINSFGFSTLMLNEVLAENKGLNINFKFIKNDRKFKNLLRLYDYLNFVFDDFINNEISPVDYFSSLCDENRKKRILINLYNMPSIENGTSIFGKDFLRSFYSKYSSKYNISILLTKEADQYHKISKKYKNVYYPGNIVPNVFDICFVPSQIFHFYNLYLINKTCLKYIFSMQDIIALRCNYIRIRNVHNVTKNVLLSLKYCDDVCAISNFSKNDTKNYYKTKFNFENINYPCVYHGLMKKRDVSIEKVNEDVAIRFHDYILIFGNSFRHKAIKETLKNIENNLKWNFVVFGSKANDLKYADNIVLLRSGGFSNSFMDNLIKNSKLIIFPSLYEGFGIILYDAITYNKKIIVNRNSLNIELKEFLRLDNIMMFDKFSEINALIDEIMKTNFIKYNHKLKMFENSIEEYEQIISNVLNKKVDFNHLKNRWEEIGNINSYFKYKNEILYFVDTNNDRFIIKIKNHIRRKHPKLFLFLKKCLKR